MDESANIGELGFVHIPTKSNGSGVATCMYLILKPKATIFHLLERESIYVVLYMYITQCPRKFLGIVSQDLGVSKSNWLHVNISQKISFIDLRYIRKNTLR